MVATGPRAEARPRRLRPRRHCHGWPWSPHSCLRHCPPQAHFELKQVLPPGRPPARSKSPFAYSTPSQPVLFDRGRVITVFAMFFLEAQQPEQAQSAKQVEPADLGRAAAQAFLRFGPDSGVVGFLSLRSRGGTMRPLQACRASIEFAWCPPVFALIDAREVQYHRMRLRSKRARISAKKQTPGPRGDPGVLRDDCSSAPLDSCRVPLSRVAASFRHRPQGAARRKNCKLCCRRAACHLLKQRAAVFAHRL